MNYYNPYLSMMPYMSAAPKVGLFSRIFGGNLGISSILSGTQKTLNIVNQTIPLIKQAGPMINNAKTMFKVMNEFKKVDAPTTKNVSQTKKQEENNVVEKQTTYSNPDKNLPTFFA